jgi:RimJ/RimL family protein N-acetyltransferase
MSKPGPIVKRLPTGRRPDDRTLYGRDVTLSPLQVSRHARDLFGAFADHDLQGDIWTFMSYGPFASFQEFERWQKLCEASADPKFLAIITRDTKKACGMASYLRIEPDHGVVEIGNIWFAPSLQRTRAATEALYLMMRHVFDELGYRRLEWKCDALNKASRNAADRLGFAFEGVFRQHLIIKGRNRDTAWYAIVDTDWPALKARIETWLDDTNFQPDGRQITALSKL